jgi:multimeric flavodoxin WrbA
MISGSRNPQGQTARAADALLEGVLQAGGTVERVFLPERHIERCRQCDAQGWGACRSDGHCCIPDDMDDLVTRIRAADALVFATPVYYGDLSESMRAFTDRVRRCATHMADPAGIKGKLAVGVCVAGGGGGGAPNCCASLQNVLSRCGFDVVDMAPVRRQNLVFKLGMLRLTGEWLATGARST